MIFTFLKAVTFVSSTKILFLLQDCEDNLPYFPTNFTICFPIETYLMHFKYILHFMWGRGQCPHFSFIHLVIPVPLLKIKFLPREPAMKPYWKSIDYILLNLSLDSLFCHWPMGLSTCPWQLSLWLYGYRGSLEIWWYSPPFSSFFFHIVFCLF